MQAPPSYRVLVIAPTSFFGDTGCHVRILEEVRLLQRLGHEVTVATYRNGRDIEGLSIRRTLPIPWRQHYEVGSSRHKIAFDFLLSLTVGRLLLTRRFDVIHGHLHEGGLIGIAAGGLFRVPVLCDLQGSLTEEMLDHGFVTRNHWLFGPLRWLEGWIVRHAGRVVASTEHFARILRAEFACPADRLQVLNDFVAVTDAAPAESATQNARAQLGIPEDAAVVAYLGLLAPYQGTDLLLEALPRVLAEEPRCHLLLMGYPFVEEYRAKARALGIDAAVTLTGRIPYPDIARYLSLGLMAVAPKLSRTEGLGKLLNYMALGLPTVAFDTPVARSYLGSLGQYARSGDAGSLAQGMLRLLRAAHEDPAAFARLRQNLRQRARERFAGEPVGVILNRLYGALIQGK